MAARQDISEEAFKGVDPMKGAIKLVKGLVSVLGMMSKDWWKYDAGVPIAIATGSNYESFKWKTVSLLSQDDWKKG